MYSASAEVLDLQRDRSLRAEVESFLLAAKMQGRIRSGERIRESEIARALGISQTPVREAILRLVHDGVVVHRPRRGFFLIEPSLEELHDIYLFRATLEGLAARLAAERISPEQAEALDHLVVEGGLAERRGERLASIEANAQLHGLIVRAAHHPLLSRTWQMLAPLQWLPRDFAVVEPPPANAADDWVARHRRLVDAILSGDPDNAEQMAQMHVLDAGHVRDGRVRLVRDG